jgi:hypothetical protein
MDACGTGQFISNTHEISQRIEGTTNGCHVEQKQLSKERMKVLILKIILSTTTTSSTRKTDGWLYQHPLVLHFLLAMTVKLNISAVCVCCLIQRLEEVE